MTADEDTSRVYEDVQTSDRYVIVERRERDTTVRNLRTGKLAIWGNDCVNDDLFVVGDRGAHTRE